MFNMRFAFSGAVDALQDTMCIKRGIHDASTPPSYAKIAPTTIKKIRIFVV